MSTCGAEIHAAVVAVKGAIHIRKMLKNLEFYPDNRPLEIAGDNSAPIAQAKTGIKYIRHAKHYKIRLCFLQQKVVEKDAAFKCCLTEHQIADFFTKPLDAAKFIWFLKWNGHEVRQEARAISCMTFQASRKSALAKCGRRGKPCTREGEDLNVC